MTALNWKVRNDGEIRRIIYDENGVVPLHLHLCLIAESVNVASRLSPSTRELILSNPEAVEKAVEFVLAARSYKGLRNSSYAPFCPTGGRFKEAMDKAIDSLKETSS